MSVNSSNHTYEVIDMKKTDIILLGGLISAILFSNFASFENTLNNIENDVLRLHILANSDSVSDQNLKIKVRDRLLENSEELFGECDTLEEMECTAEEKLDEINNIVLEVIDENGFDYTAQTNLVNMEFDNRVYGGMTMPAGNYEALRITIGEAEGHNWWCVMYPPLCIPVAESVVTDENTAEKYFSEDELDIMENPQNYKVKFKCAEVFRNIKNKISDFF